MTAGNYSVYVLENSEGRFYIGLTDDVPRRVSQHNSGVSKWTRGKGPWKLVWQTCSLTLSQARKLERELKRQKGGNGFFRMTGLERGHGSIIPPAGPQVQILPPQPISP